MNACNVGVKASFLEWSVGFPSRLEQLIEQHKALNDIDSMPARFCPRCTAARKVANTTSNVEDDEKIPYQCLGLSRAANGMRSIQSYTG